MPGVAVDAPAHAAPIEQLRVASYTIPTDRPEADGTLAWRSTTMVTVEVAAGGMHGFGYTYTSAAAATVISDVLAPAVTGRDATAIPDCWAAMQRAVRNLGREGLASTAIAAVDVALWDLKAKLFDVPLVALLGSVRSAVPVYGSGGFTTYSLDELRDQLAGWVADGIPRVKMKIGADVATEHRRVATARKAIGDDTELFVDANGAYPVKRAVVAAEWLAAEADVRWFEEPVTSDDPTGLRFIREHAPPVIDVAAGEYGYTADDFRHLLHPLAVDVLQADATRCGITGFLLAGALCSAEHLPLSAHCAPTLHASVCCAVPAVRHVEYFHDHVRIEGMLFDSAPVPVDGAIAPDRSRPGLGITFKRQDAARYEVTA